MDNQVKKSKDGIDEKRVIWHRGRFMIGDHLDAFYSPCFWYVNPALLPDSHRPGKYWKAICFSFLRWWFVIGFKFYDDE